MQLVVFIIALLSSAALTRWIRDLAIARNWVAPPGSGRHLHTRPTPRLGGVAIFLTLWEMTLIARLSSYFGMTDMVSPHLALGILGPATIIFALGLVDDIRGLGPYTKVAVQIVAATLLFVNGFGISHLSIGAGGATVGWIIGLPLTIVWVLWITNAFNLIDGLDGLAAGSALFSTLVICVIAILGHNNSILFLTLALAGAIAGVLRYNFNPASIFLGDCGSLLIGFILSAIALAGSQKSPTMVAVAIPIVSLGLPILDVTIAVIRRILSGHRIFVADREHIHHKLINRGVSHKQAVLMLYGVSACFGLLSLLLLNPDSQTIGIVLGVLGIGVLVGVQQLRYHEFLELGQVAVRSLNLRQVIANNVSIRRTAAALESCETIGESCRVLQNCLQPIGFDGFDLHFSSDLPAALECAPFKQIDRTKLQLSWDQSPLSTEANWSLSLCLAASNGRRLARFTVYRKSTVAPFWVDLNAFTTTGFILALSRMVERLQDRWLIEELTPQRPAWRTPVASATGT
ncbi:MAG TPA: MraY family glycosyltransferase [Candidatus Saccharimonadales bacterium]|nr:MraY family glycosyltransferase [Candidatus Saccharimonadales bacterium]